MTFSDDDPVVIVHLGELDLNEIKRLTNLATSMSNTFISFTTATVQDMNENFVRAIISSTAVMITNLIPDVIPPSLRRFNLDMDNGELSLSMRQAMLAV